MMLIRSRFATHVLLLATCIGGFSTFARAGERYMAPGASVDDYRNALMATRGIRRTPVPASTATKGLRSASHLGGKAEAVPESVTSGLSIKIYFAYNSDELTSQAKNELDKLGVALGSPEFNGARWLIEGHTDAAGTPQYNQQLSERRAISVYQYLVSQYGIAASQLTPVGKGESELYDPKHPDSALNRRVRIRPLD
jgi:outer membrane protein OmpA-like peptidoglycan-associated protein